MTMAILAVTAIVIFAGSKLRARHLSATGWHRCPSLRRPVDGHWLSVKETDT